MTKYKIKNPLDQPVRCGYLYFNPKETKILDFIPGKGFIIEEIEDIKEKTEEPKIKKLKGGNK
jgi:hypothetical protein